MILLGSSVGKNQTIEWAMHQRVMYHIAEKLDYSSNVGKPVYHELTAYMVLFYEVSNQLFCRASFCSSDYVEHN
jgi:hypothetical protein